MTSQFNLTQLKYTNYEHTITRIVRRTRRRLLSIGVASMLNIVKNRLVVACCFVDHLDAEPLLWVNAMKARVFHESPTRHFSIETPDTGDYTDYRCDCIKRYIACVY